MPKGKFWRIPLEDRFMANVEITDGCWFWRGTVQVNGYGTVSLKYIKAHRLSYEIFNGPIPKGLWVCHSCDIKICVNPEHLWLGTVKDNSGDAAKKGLYRPLLGDENPCCKLSEDEVRAIRKELRNGKRVCELGRKYGVRHTAISRIRDGERWGWLDNPNFKQRTATAV